MRAVLTGLLFLTGCSSTEVRTSSSAVAIANGNPSIFFYRERIIGGMGSRFEVNANGVIQRLKTGDIAVLPIIDGANIIFGKPIDLNMSQPAMMQVTSDGKTSKYLVIRQVFSGVEFREVSKTEWEDLVHAQKLRVF